MTARNPFKMECVEWPKAINATGYGVATKQRGRTQLAHRLTYEKEFGPIGKGRHIHHLCGNRACIEPDHLINVTAWEHNNWFGARKSKIKFCKRGHVRTHENLDSGGHCRICRIVRGADPEKRAAKAAYDREYRERNGERLRAHDRQRARRK